MFYDKLKEKINSLSIEQLRNGLLNTVFAHPSSLHVEVDCILHEPSFFASELSEDIAGTDKKKRAPSSGAVEDVISKIKADMKNALRKYERKFNTLTIYWSANMLSIFARIACVRIK